MAKLVPLLDYIDYLKESDEFETRCETLIQEFGEYLALKGENKSVSASGEPIN